MEIFILKTRIIIALYNKIKENSYLNSYPYSKSEIIPFWQLYKSSHFHLRCML